MFVNATVEIRRMGTELVWPICIKVAPKPAWTHSGTVMTMVVKPIWPSELVAQIRTLFVVLPWEQDGVHRKTPSTLSLEPAGAVLSRPKLKGGLGPLA